MTKDTSRVGVGTAMGWGAWLCVAGVLSGCSMLKKAPADAGDEGGAEAAVAVVEAAAPAVAVNEADVTRYPDEKATAGSTLTTEGPAELRTEVGPGGKLVVDLKKGTEVDKVAEHANHYLVIAEDPRDATRKLMGWSGEGAFTGGGYGHGSLVPHAGDGGAVAAGDAGHAVASADAGGGAPPAPATPAAAGGSCVKQGAGGTCPAGFKANGAVCRFVCKAPTDCKGPDPKCNGGLCYASNGCQ